MRWGVIVGALLVPVFAFAANTTFFGPLVPPCTEYAGDVAMCQACNLVQLTDNVLRFFVSLAVMASAIMFAYAGFLYVTAASNQHNIESAKKIFWNVLLGLIFVLIAFLLVDLVLKAFTSGNTSFNVLTRIQCVQIKQSGLKFEFPVVPGKNPVSAGGQDQNEPGGQTFDAPAGSCVAASQSAIAAGVKPTPDCNPGQRVQTYGDVSCTQHAASIKKQWGSVIDHCARQAGIPSSVLVAISRVECSGAATCKDPTGVGQGATGVSLSEVRSYCSSAVGRGTNECAGVGGMSDAQLKQRLSTDQQLSFCATANAMKRSYTRYGSWSLAAAAYNGGDRAVLPSRNCPGMLAYQCPVSSGTSQYPYCTVTCAYQDIFDACVNAAGGL